MPELGSFAVGALATTTAWDCQCHCLWAGSEEPPHHVLQLSGESFLQLDAVDAVAFVVELDKIAERREIAHTLEDPSRPRRRWAPREPQVS